MRSTFDEIKYAKSRALRRSLYTQLKSLHELFSKQYEMGIQIDY